MAESAASVIIREFLVDLHRSYLSDIAEMRKAADSTGLSLSTVSQAVSIGKGSAITHGLLICYGMKLSPDGLKSHLPKFKKMFAGGEKLSVLEDLLQKVLKVYTIDEIILFLETMLAKDKIERRMGLKKKLGRPKNKTE